MSRERFGASYEEGVKLVAHYLLSEWLLKACFENLHVEGLTKEFYLAAICQRNLELTRDILYCIMTSREWQGPTPPSESDEQLFRMDPEEQAKVVKRVETYWRDLL